MSDSLCAREVLIPNQRELVIHPLSDLHLEAQKHDRKALEAKLGELRGLIEKEPEKHRILLMGDILDAAIVGSKGYYPGAPTVKEALEYAASVLKPLTPNIDLILPGNHEERITRITGLDVLDIGLATQLGLAETYRPLPTVVKYSFAASSGQTRLHAQVFCHHGYGGGSTTGPTLNKLKSFTLWKPDCHVYMMGHTHKQAADTDKCYIGWPVREHERLYVATGTYLGHEDYAQKLGLPPTRSESPVVHLTGDIGTGRVRARVTL